MKYLLSIILIAAAELVYAQTTVSGSFEHGGITRTYSFYVPASYVPGIAVPMVIGLHGLSSDGEEFAQNRDFRPIADTANFIVVHPDGSTMFGVHFWNYDNVLGSTVDDVGFLEALIDTISAQYTINPLRIYATGMSNGSFMCYALACQSNRFAAIGTVTGSMSVDMYEECDPENPIPVLHIHGTDDSVNDYEGTSTMQGIEDVNLFWVNENNCSTIPVTVSVPDVNTTDNASAVRYIYSGGNDGHTVELFKINGGGHTWPGWPVSGSSGNTCMDFDACNEIWRFFNQYELVPFASVSKEQTISITLWPNPASESISIQVEENHPVTNITIRDASGRIVKTESGSNIPEFEIGHLDSGSYILEISGFGFSVSKTMMITGN